MEDSLEKLGGSLLQHGSSNNRIYLIKYSEQDLDLIFSKFDELVEKNSYSKIFVKIAESHEPLFLAKGFVREAFIPAFYGKQGAVFMGKFFDGRETIAEKKQTTIKDVLSVAENKKSKVNDISLPDGYTIRQLTTSDATPLCELYRQVFASYPFPIFDVAYIRQTMQSNVIYLGCFYKDELIAASSAEMDLDTQSVEMTDFATLADFRGKNISLILLRHMEETMPSYNIRTMFTIARSYSYGMNCTFSRSGYNFCGTLINNTNISGQIESMNIWSKSLWD